MISQSIRRRLQASSAVGVELTLSKYEMTVTADSSSSNYIYVYGDGQLLKDDGVTVEYSGCVTGATYTKSSAKVTISVGANDSISNTRSGLVTVKYKGGRVHCSITQKQCEIKGYSVTSATCSSLTAQVNNVTELGYHSWSNTSHYAYIPSYGSMECHFSTVMNFRPIYSGSYVDNTTITKSYSINSYYTSIGGGSFRNDGGLWFWSDLRYDPVASEDEYDSYFVDDNNRFGFYVIMKAPYQLVESENLPSNVSAAWFRDYPSWDSNNTINVQNLTNNVYLKMNVPKVSLIIYSFSGISGSYFGNSQYVNLSSPLITLTANITSSGIDIQKV